MCEKSKLDEVSAHSTALDAIELDVAAILTNRMEWIRSFTGKSKESIEVLEKIYVEISSTALDGLESEEDKVTIDSFLLNIMTTYDMILLCTLSAFGIVQRLLCSERKVPEIVSCEAIRTITTCWSFPKKIDPQFSRS